MSDKAKKKLLRAVLCSLFAAIICVIAPHAIPTTVPLTLATLGIYICSCTLPPAMSTVSILLYLAIGAVGVPVFSGYSGGIGKLAGPTGGYLVGYLPMAFVISLIVTLLVRREKRPPIAVDIAIRMFACVLGTVVLYTFGTVWYVIQQKTTFAAALPLCVFPFIPGDIAKIVAAALISRGVEKAAGSYIGQIGCD